MSKLREFLAWFRDSQQISPRALSRPESLSRGEVWSRAARLGLESPHYYAFYYPPGRDPRKRPKQYFGPFEYPSGAQDAVRVDSEKYRAPRSAYEVRRLTADQFEEIWGARLQLHEGYWGR